MQVYRRIALLGAVANPNIGDEAVLAANIQKIRKLYGVNCKIYVFQKTQRIPLYIIRKMDKL